MKFRLEGVVGVVSRIVPLLACALLLAWGGCGTVVRNPGDDDDNDETARDSREGKSTPPPSSSIGGLKPCSALLSKTPGAPGSVTLRFIAQRGQPPVDLTVEYAFTVLRADGSKVGTSPVDLRAPGTYGFSLSKGGKGLCLSRLDVTKADLSAGGEWTFTVTPPG